jgi:nucleotide-binding universal stress UspA family protein
MFKKILVCLDGSKLSEEIIPYVAEEAHCIGKVVMLGVVPIPQFDVPIGVPGAPGAPIRTEGMLKEYRMEITEVPAYLETQAKKLRDKGLDVECVVLQGPPGETIVEYALEHKIELLALATHGHSGLRRVVFGSTAEYVLRKVGLPVLLITPRG